jgi:hypothetical protein
MGLVTSCRPGAITIMDNYKRRRRDQRGISGKNQDNKNSIEETFKCKEE